MSDPDWVRPLAAALARARGQQRTDALRPARGARPAAVLILIGTGADGPEILFVERYELEGGHADCAPES